MKCVRCKKKANTIDVRHANGFDAVHRKYECGECGTTFSTSEKVMFNTLPRDIKERYLESGER